MKIRLTRLARRELIRAASWYDRQRIGLGDELLDDVAVALAFLKEFPKAPPLIGAGFRRLLLRRFPFGLIFQSDDREIVIVAVAHNNRRPGHWRKRRQRDRG